MVDIIQLIVWFITCDEREGSVHVLLPCLALTYVNVLRMQYAIPAAAPYVRGVKLHTSIPMRKYYTQRSTHTNAYMGKGAN